MRIGVSRGRVIVRGTLVVWCLDMWLVALFAVVWWFWVPGGTWLSASAIGPVTGVAFAAWWLLAAGLIIDPGAGRVTYVGLRCRSVPMESVTGVDLVSRIQSKQGVPCLRLKMANGSIKCRAVSAVSASPVHLTAVLVDKVLTSAPLGRPITRAELAGWRYAVRPDRPATRSLLE